jgi:hypothetical protein
MPALLNLDDDEDDLLDDDVPWHPDPDPSPAACGSPEQLRSGSPPPPSSRPLAATPCLAPAVTTSSSAPTSGACSYHSLDGSPTPTRMATSSPTGTPPRSSERGALSLDADSFLPMGHSGSRGKQLRWRDDSPSLTEDGSPSYRDVLLRQPLAAV